MKFYNLKLVIVTHVHSTKSSNQSCIVSSCRAQYNNTNQLEFFSRKFTKLISCIRTACTDEEKTIFENSFVRIIEKLSYFEKVLIDVPDYTYTVKPVYIYTHGAREGR